ncbi:hypothetical protein AB0B66_10155 [Catellatospora sp. NPDC049111]|uniref:hypothetical protein n=1 Tax=Catellatospora sp. NPDC049111 TaxID=3155271 RepID=UPI0033E881D0
MARTPSPLRKPLEHRKPTDTTVKRLYSTAFGCCKPGCGQPLLRQSDSTDEFLLNSRVAHIHARSEGGPRWDPQMSENDNRSYDNLLLLCIPHATEIDDTYEHFPPAMLREWKSSAVDEFERTRRNWPLDDRQVAEIVAASFDPRPLLETIAASMPFSARMRTREQALERTAAKARARRSVRLSALVPAQKVAEVIAWMAGNEEHLDVVPEGSVRVLVAPMGAGKSERALRWLEEGLGIAESNGERDVPLWLNAREITGSLESAVGDGLGAEPANGCRIVIDDLDGVSLRKADHLLMQARELVTVWPRACVLATARPGVPVHQGEVVRVEPWPRRRGGDLLRLLVGERIPWGIWAPETSALLGSPLTVLAFAARINASGDTNVTRLELLSDVAGTIIRSRLAEQATEETWRDLAQLAIRILDSSSAVRTSSFGIEPRVRKMTATDLVVDDEGLLSFALPLFEQHYGAQAIISDAVDLDTIAAPDAFARWRYAIAFAVASGEPRRQEQLMKRLAQLHPAAASWVLSEVAPDGRAHTEQWNELTDGKIIAMIKSRGGAAGASVSSTPAVVAAEWLREAQQALLDGVGPLAQSLAAHHDGQLVQWGAWLQSAYLTVAEARDSARPPAVTQLDSIHPDITISAGWERWTQQTFPDAEFGRWLWARERLQEELHRILQRRTLPLPAQSRLAAERLWYLSNFVIKFSAGRVPDRIEVGPLRDKVAEWMDNVRSSVNSTWQGSGGSVESDDIRWLDAQLEHVTADVLEPPWPRPDQPHRARRWAWESYSPELTLSIAQGVLRDALAGYRDLVETNFAAFGVALGLQSILPVRADGFVVRPDEGKDAWSVRMIVSLTHDLTVGVRDDAPIELRLITDDSQGIVREFAEPRVQNARQVAFGPSPIDHLAVRFNAMRPATNLAYEWLMRDLKSVGWLDRSIRYSD